jgi:hypothetical protein
MHDYDETTRLREQDSADRHDRSREDDGGGATPSAVLATTGGSPYPTASGQYYTMTAIALYGATTLGTSPPSVTIGGTFQAVGYGAIPNAGTPVICKPVGSRWAFYA